LLAKPQPLAVKQKPKPASAMQTAASPNPVPAGASVSIPAIRKVLVATDFSALGNDAIRHARSLLPANGEVRIVHVCPSPSAGVNPVIASEVYFDHSLDTARMVAEAEEKMRSLVPSQGETGGIVFSSEVMVHDNTADGICEAAERFGADVICLGARGHSRLASMLLGSVVQSVLSRSHCPVLVIPPRRR
jgi:nucleotide-binding universal stress UspA family protein